MPGKRKSIRLKNYDYTQEGRYFVTVCADNRKCLFGRIRDAEMILNESGKMAEKYWNQIPRHFPHAELDEYIVMPNHIHAIIKITVNVGANNHSPLTNIISKNRAKNISPLQMHQMPLKRHGGTSKTIGSIIRGFKIGVTKWFRKNTETKKVWQRNYYERIIRNESELNRIRQYVIDNPAKWENDRYYPG